MDFRDAMNLLRLTANEASAELKAGRGRCTLQAECVVPGHPIRRIADLPPLATGSRAFRPRAGPLSALPEPRVAERSPHLGRGGSRNGSMRLFSNR